MNIVKKSFVFLISLITILFLFPHPVYAQDPDHKDGEIVFGGTYRLESGQTLTGDLIIIGGQGIIEENAILDGDVLLIGGIFSVKGKVDGSISAIGGTVTLEDTAYVDGDINTFSGYVSKSPKATLTGKMNQDIRSSIRLPIVIQNPIPPAAKPQETPSPTPVPQAPVVVVPPVDNTFQEKVVQPAWTLLTILLQSLTIAVLATLAILFFNAPIERISDVIIHTPIASAAMGLLTLIVAPALLILLIFTLILSPLGIIGLLIIFLGIILGWISLGLALGKRFSSQIHKEWAPPISGGLGTFIFTFVALLFNQIYCVGWVIPFLIGITSLGGVILSRFGSRYNSGPRIEVENSSATSSQ